MPATAEMTVVVSEVMMPKVTMAAEAKSNRDGRSGVAPVIGITVGGIISIGSVIGGACLRVRYDVNT